jgi:hypothetical protein
MKWTLLGLVLGASGAAMAAEPSAPPAASSPATPGGKAKAKSSRKAPAPKASSAQGAAGKKASGKPQPVVPPMAPSATPTPMSEALRGFVFEDDEAPLPYPLTSVPVPPDLPVPPIYRQPFTWDVPKVVGIVDVPGVMLADGVPVRMRAVRSAEKPEPLLQHMVDRWMEWGLYIAPLEQQPQTLREPMITALDPERLITYTVIIQANPDGTTTLYLGEADMSKPPSAVSSVAPVFPGAQKVMTSELEVVRSVNYTIDAKAAEVEAFYRTELGKMGFKEVKPRLFRGGGEELELLLNPLEPGKLSVAVLRRTVAPQAPGPTGD